MEEVKDSEVTMARRLDDGGLCHSLLSKIHNQTSMMGPKP
jgi:hypothetical protein